MPQSRSPRVYSPRRAYDIIRSALRSGQIPPKALLNEHELVTELGMTRSSVRAALQRLAADGLVTRARRAGTVAAAVPPIEIHRSLLIPTEAERVIRTISDRFGPAGPLLRERMRLDESEVHISEQEIRVAGELVGVRTTYEPATVTASPIEVNETDYTQLAAVFRERYAVELKSVQARAEATLADEITAQTLRIRPGSPVLLIEVAVIGADDRLRALIHVHYVAQRVVLPLGPAASE